MRVGHGGLRHSDHVAGPVTVIEAQLESGALGQRFIAAANQADGQSIGLADVESGVKDVVGYGVGSANGIVILENSDLRVGLQKRRLDAVQLVMYESGKGTS